jgi:hypothetical protein
VPPRSAKKTIVRPPSSQQRLISYSHYKFTAFLNKPAN